ncbi:unnamed protein product [marine sediment metagenome]|uniref:Uncharacterized protein n=1 Tax=marine sediment metagenome TaxID=412755 RepID=X0YNZ5_9ZZZZ
MKELLEKIKKKLKEVKSIRNLGGRDFRFKNWHASTINLLKNLPSDFILDVNDFKKLTFTDTKYHRGNRFFNPLDNTKYREDLDSAVKILKKITLSKKEGYSPEIYTDNASKLKKYKSLLVVLTVITIPQIYFFVMMLTRFKNVPPYSLPVTLLYALILCLLVYAIVRISLIIKRIKQDIRE